MRKTSAETAEQNAHEIAALPIEIVPVDSDLILARQAALQGREKAVLCQVFQLRYH